MPTTSLKINKEDGTKRLRFSTSTVVSKEDSTLTQVDIYFCDEDFIPQGDAITQVTTISEETFHTELRKEAQQKGHYVKEFSTNPEWDKNLES